MSGEWFEKLFGFQEGLGGWARLSDAERNTRYDVVQARLALSSVLL